MKLLAALTAVAAMLAIATPAVASVKVGSCTLAGNVPGLNTSGQVQESATLTCGSSTVEQIKVCPWYKTSSGAWTQVSASCKTVTRTATSTTGATALPATVGDSYMVWTWAWASGHAASTTGPSWTDSGYVSPFATTYTVGRTDMGVDICLPARAAINAIGNGTVLGISPNWYLTQPYLWYRLTSGPYAGQVIYVAEQITPVVTVGQTVTAGQPIATFAASGTCIEMGWGDPAGTGWTLAQVTTGYKEGQATQAGVSFAKFLMSLGLTGSFELTPTALKRVSHRAAIPGPAASR